MNLGNSELSLKLGHNRNYISRVLHQENPTPEQMTKVVDKVKELLPEFKHTPISDAVMVSKDEYDGLKKKLDHKNQVLDKRNAVLENHISRVNELESQLKQLSRILLMLLIKRMPKLKSSKMTAIMQQINIKASVRRLCA